MHRSDDDASRAPWPEHDRHGGGFLPPPTRPPKLQGGVRLTGAAPRSWWARRWIARFEALARGDRVQRGLAYARGGNVRTFDIDVAEVRATVQGTRRTPYEVRLQLAPIDQGAWIQVADALAGRAAYRAALLDGSMPDDVEAVCARAGVHLFPADDDDVRVSCTCDDWASPCRHVSAVCHLVAAAVDRDPLLVFQLRGIQREVLVALVRGRALEQDVTEHRPEDAVSTASVEDRFWSVRDDGRPAPVDVELPAIDAPLVRILGAPPHWSGELPFEGTVAAALARAGRDPWVVDLALGVRSDGRSS